MKLNHAIFTFALLGIFSLPLFSQDSGSGDLPYKWNELTAPDFVKAVELSDGICILPAGIIEKHGPHLPLSTDMILAREISSRAAGLEYALVFPEFYFGQIYEAKHQPGTMAYSTELVWMMLDYYDHTLDEAFLKERVLPVAEEVLAFFEHYYKTDSAGKLVMHPSQAVETWWECTNPMPEVAGLRWVAHGQREAVQAEDPVHRHARGEGIPRVD